MVQVDVLVNNAGLALGTAGVHQNDIQVVAYDTYAVHSAMFAWHAKTADELKSECIGKGAVGRKA